MCLVGGNDGFGLSAEVEAVAPMEGDLLYNWKEEEEAFLFFILFVFIINPKILFYFYSRKKERNSFFILGNAWSIMVHVRRCAWADLTVRVSELLCSFSTKLHVKKPGHAVKKERIKSICYF